MPSRPSNMDKVPCTKASAPGYADEILDDEDDLDTVGEGITDGLWVIPQFKDKFAERQWAKSHLAGAFRVFAKFGYTDGSGGHISLRDPVREDCFWISKLPPADLETFDSYQKTHIPCTLA